MLPEDGTNDSRIATVSEKLGALLWLLCFQFFVAEQIARLACTTPYSMRTHVISDLGAVHCGVVAAAAKATAHAVCSPLHGLMNGSFILQGLLIFFGSMLVRKSFPIGRAFTSAIALLALSGLGVLVVGIAPEDVHLQAHSGGAAVNFIAGGLGMLVLGIALLRTLPGSKTPGWISVAAGTTCLLATALLAMRGTMLSDLNWGIGTVERFAAYPLPLWLTGMGYALLIRRNTEALFHRETVE